MKNLRPMLADATALGTFALLARIAHRTPDFPLTVGGWASTLWPFLVGGGLGWGAATLARQNGATMRGGLLVWLLTLSTGLGIWGLKRGEIPHWSFMMVAGSTSAVLMFGWRAIAAAKAKKA
ncbi:DUF3054 domain-containing protein [Corynebacterium caspium]|uniref:DUF3054 domain-containing protein n=1 Tax=Corynebacterium caspium TaxID=234828 RepID=UPI00035E4A22|nr:DUF3054 domain-containing protein [Corynebacterium caspium]WKD59969.1 hypothetical protein CCASP_07970 [Corynebacterium caspium DSM 44850]